MTVRFSKVGKIICNAQRRQDNKLACTIYTSYGYANEKKHNVFVDKVAAENVSIFTREEHENIIYSEGNAECRLREYEKKVGKDIILWCKG